MAIGIDVVVEKKIDMLHCHVSQFYEWLPYNSGTLNSVPDTAEGQRDWLAERLRKRFSTIAENNRSLLINLYGVKKGLDMQYAETFESCEYGSSLTSENLPVLFPFFE